MAKSSPLKYREIIQRAIRDRDGDNCAGCGEPLAFMDGDIHHIAGENNLASVVLVHERCHFEAHNYWRK